LSLLIIAQLAGGKGRLLRVPPRSYDEVDSRIVPDIYALQSFNLQVLKRIHPLADPCLAHDLRLSRRLASAHEIVEASALLAASSL